MLSSVGWWETGSHQQFCVDEGGPRRVGGAALSLWAGAASVIESLRRRPSSQGAQSLWKRAEDSKRSNCFHIAPGSPQAGGRGDPGIRLA
jgi:hypothetical protein